MKCIQQYSTHETTPFSKLSKECISPHTVAVTYLQLALSSMFCAWPNITTPEVGGQ